MGWLKIQKLEYILRMKHNFSIKQKNSEPVPQMAHFEKLLFCSGGNLSSLCPLFFILFFFSPNDWPSKTMKNTFYLI